MSKNEETIFNLFPICNNGIISGIGFRTHLHEGSDEEKLNYLQTQIENDVKKMSIVSLPNNFKVKLPDGKEVVGITAERFNTLIQNGTEPLLYESIFRLTNAPANPLTISTMFVDGEIKISETKTFETEPTAPYTSELIEHISEDYKQKFSTPEGFLFTELINEDFIDAIRILFQKEKFVSSVKLLMSAIDTFAYVEFGDTQGNFKMWLSTYCKLSEVNVTEDDLWEYRNSILHMTNAQSRKVIKDKMMRLSFYVSEEDRSYLTNNGVSQYFNLKSLIHVINAGIVKWAETYQNENAKFKTFMERYNQVVSDGRYNRLLE